MDSKCGCGFRVTPFVANIEQAAVQNQNFRKEFWTGNHLQMVLMSIPVRGEIGLEIHEDTDQYIRIEQGIAIVAYGNCKNNLDSRYELCSGDAVFVPAGTWHNVINVGNRCLNVSSVYAPPHHKRGTVQRTKEDAE